MNRRNFIKNSAMAAALLGIAPSLSAATEKAKTNKKIVFVLRGVAWSDALKALQKANLPTEVSFHMQKIECTNASFTHAEGMQNLLAGLTGKKSLTQTQTLERYQINEVLSDVFSNSVSGTQIIHLHHTEIGHSSSKLYTEKLEEFFIELGKQYPSGKHKIIVTGDIGRNEKTNSCGGRDHSNTTCLETFALYLGGKASQLASNDIPIAQTEVLKQKF